MAKKPMSQQELLALPTMITLKVAARALNVEETIAYRWARADQFPVPVHRVGQGHWRVPTAPLLRYLGIERDHSNDTHGPTSDGEATFSRAVRRPLDFRESAPLAEPVYVKNKRGERIRVNPKKTYTIKGRRILGADLIAERQA